MIVESERAHTMGCLSVRVLGEKKKTITASEIIIHQFRVSLRQWAFNLDQMPSGSMGN